MLRHLYIQDFAIAPMLELSFRGGFTTITGETGAGKSILVDALGLLVGARSDVSWVRAGADRAQLSAEFDLAGNAQALAWLDEAELADEDRCLLRRSIASGGRSRAWINGTPVTVGQLNELGSLLVEIHGQNEHLQLARPEQQLRLLDGSGGYAEARDAVARTFLEWQELDRSWQELRNSSALSGDELDLLKFQLAELVEHALSEPEIEALEVEHRRLSRSGDLVRDLGDTAGALVGDDGGLADELHRLLGRVRPHADLDPGISEALRMLEEAAIDAQEAAHTLEQVLDRIDLSPERLQQVRSQLDVLGDLSRKHRVPMERLITQRDALAARVERAEHFEEHRAELENRLAAALKIYREAARELSEHRSAHAEELSARVSTLMGELGMEGGICAFLVDADPTRKPSPRGDDRVELLVSANPGFTPGPLAKIASGGELSRISLAIKVATSKIEHRTQVFDEVDAGIGGETANTVGRLLSRLAKGGQALCVTHLAQVAVCAGQQLCVDKSSGKADVKVSTRLLDEDQRVMEIARMLSGESSEHSLAHARALLEAATAA